MNPRHNFSTYCSNLYQELGQRLEYLSQEECVETSRFEAQITLVQTFVRQLRLIVLSNPFGSTKDEIHFMKKVLPEFLCPGIYYSEKADLEAARLIESATLREELLARQQERIGDFFRQNIELIQYYYSGRDWLDEYYFLRPQEPVSPATAFSVECAGPAFCTIYSVKLGMLLAYRRLENEIQRPQMAPASTMSTLNTKTGSLEWTDSKSGLLELIYSLKHKGAFNHGKADIKTIADHFSRHFSVELGNPSSSFQKILRRKGSTTYLDQLRDQLLVRVDQLNRQEKK